MRLEHLVCGKLAITRSASQKLIRSGRVFVSGNKILKPGYLCDDYEEVTISDEQQIDFSGVEIIHNDDSIAIVYKPPGIVTSGIKTKRTLCDFLPFSQLSNIYPEEPGMVHRLDKDTEGLLVVAKTNDVHCALRSQIQNRSMQRVYLAHVKGHPQCGRWENWMGRSGRQKMKILQEYVESRFTKQVIMHTRLLDRLDTSSIIECTLETGAQHQIRCQACGRGHPVIGDPIYGKRKSRQLMLCAYKLSFYHPTTNKLCMFRKLPDWLPEKIAHELC